MFQHDELCMQNVASVTFRGSGKIARHDACSM